MLKITQSTDTSVKMNHKCLSNKQEPKKLRSNRKAMEPDQGPWQFVSAAGPKNGSVTSNGVKCSEPREECVIDRFTLI